MQAANATIQAQIAEIDRRIRRDNKRRRDLVCVLYGLPGAKRSKKTAVGTRKKKQLESLPTDMLEAVVDRVGCHDSYKRLHLVCKAASRMVATAGHVGVLWVGTKKTVESIEQLEKHDWSGLGERYKYTGVRFGERFNLPVDKLPAGLTHLQLGYDFNQPVNNLPAGLTHLQVGAEFDQPMHKLPASLTHLLLGYDFFLSEDKMPGKIILEGLHIEPATKTPRSRSTLY